MTTKRHKESLQNATNHKNHYKLLKCKVTRKILSVTKTGHKTKRWEEMHKMTTNANGQLKYKPQTSFT